MCLWLKEKANSLPSEKVKGYSQNNEMPYSSKAILDFLCDNYIKFLMREAFKYKNSSHL